MEEDVPQLTPVDVTPYLRWLEENPTHEDALKVLTLYSQLVVHNINAEVVRLLRDYKTTQDKADDTQRST